MDKNLKKKVKEIVDEREEYIIKQLILTFNLQTVNVEVADGHVTYLSLKFKKIKSILKQVSVFFRLEELDLSQNEIKKIEYLENLTYLKKLHLQDNMINRISGIENCEVLEYLDLSNNHLHDIDGLHNCFQLKTLILSRNHIKKIEGFDNLQNLTILKLNHNPIEKIENLRNQFNLEELSISRAELRNIEGLQFLRNLRLLDLASNKILRIIGLNNNLLLKEINLNKNKIRKLENLEHLTNLSKISLQYNEMKGKQNKVSLQSIDKIKDFILNQKRLEQVVMKQQIKKQTKTDEEKKIELESQTVLHKFSKHKRKERKRENTPSQPPQKYKKHSSLAEFEVLEGYEGYEDHESPSKSFLNHISHSNENATAEKIEYVEKRKPSPTQPDSEKKQDSRAQGKSNKPKLIEQKNIKLVEKVSPKFKKEGQKAQYSTPLWMKGKRKDAVEELEDNNVLSNLEKDGRIVGKIQQIDPEPFESGASENSSLNYDGYDEIQKQIEEEKILHVQREKQRKQISQIIKNVKQDEVVSYPSSSQTIQVVSPQLIAKVIPSIIYNTTQKVVPVPKPKINLLNGKNFKNSMEWVQYGDELNKKEDYNKAIISYSNAIQLNINNVEAWKNTGIAFNNKGDFKRAILSFNQGLTKDSSNALMWLFLGISYFNTNQMEKSLGAFYETLRIDPQNSLTKTYMAQIPQDLKVSYDKMVDYKSQISLVYNVIKKKSKDHSLSKRRKVFHERYQKNWLKIINEYTILKLLNFTDTSRLWVVQESQLMNNPQNEQDPQKKQKKQKFVLKHILLQDDPKNKEIARSLAYKEITILSKLHSPNIVPLLNSFLGYFQKDAGYCIVYPFYAYGSLKERISNVLIPSKNIVDNLKADKLFTTKSILNLLITLYETIVYLHENKIVHRDIKPSNIMINSAPDRNLKPSDIIITGFGLALSEDVDNYEEYGEEHNIAGGTIGFTAPEQINQGFVGLNSDLYSAGASLYNTLTLQKYMGTFTLPDWISDHYNNIEFLTPVIQKALDIDPNKRSGGIENIKGILVQLKNVAQHSNW